MNNDKNQVLVSGAVVVRRNKEGDLEWFLTKQVDDGKWEIPKVIVRKGESSVRAALRVTGEKGGMTTRVLEEAGRAGGVATVGGKTVSQRYLYYLMLLKASSGEPIGFGECGWFEYPSASKKLSSKRERIMLKQAKEEFVKWKKAREAKRKKEKQLQQNTSV